MLKLYHSNDLEVLKGILLSLMEQDPPLPFQKEALLVQSQGMAHWLKLQIADGLGVAAQLDFPLPSSFVWQVFNALYPDLPERSHFDKDLMSWKLMQLLPQLATEPQCEPIAQYLKNDQSGIRCYQLAQTIADVFDQYLVYRPDWLLAWEEGMDDIEDADIQLQPWQPIVWRALVATSESLGHSLQHRARIQHNLREQIVRHPERLAQLPKRIFVFGIAALPGSYWEVLEAISDHMDVHYLLLNPCRNFWGDLPNAHRRVRILQRSPDAADYLDRGNPLLASWGKLERDFLTRVHDSEQVHDLEAWVDPEEDTLLQKLQADILLLNDRQQPAFSEQALTSSEFKPAVRTDDDSIRIVSAHSPLREVQRLHDQLLHWFQQDATLKPRDIVVMVPDIDQYAPYIEAVFSSAGLSEADRARRIPWAIADQSQTAENPLLESYLALLGLPSSRLLITDVEDWLEVPAIRARFDIEEADLPLIHEWLTRAHVRWGIDGEHRRELGMTGFEQNSWRKGLRQLLLGMISPDDGPGWAGDWPVPAVEGTQAELLGNLMDFVDQLADWQQRLNQSHSVADWVQLGHELVDAFFDAEGAMKQMRSQASTQQEADPALSIQLIRDAITAWQRDLELAGLLSNDEPAPETPTPSSHSSVNDTNPLMLPARVVQRQMTERLTQQGGWQRFLAGPVNVCTLMPMRSIPFRAVCMLGMNDADYPRKVDPVGFDLMVSGKSRPGDRSRRDDDRFLFLEALCSARDYFYVSYRGRSQQDNAEQQPSVLVSELIDYLCDSYRLPQHESVPHETSRAAMREWLLECLPLQPFNPKAFAYSEPATEQSGAAAEQRQIGGFHPLWASVANHVANSVTSHDQSVAEPSLPLPLMTPGSGFLDAELTLPEELKAVLVSEKPSEGASRAAIQWRDVKQACRDSCAFFFKRRLKANLEWQGDDRQTEEPFQPNALESYWLRSVILTELVESHSGETIASRLQSLGRLPVGVLGAARGQELVNDLTPLAQRLQSLGLEQAESGAFVLDMDWTSADFGALSVSIQSERVCQLENRLIRYRPGKLRGQDWLDFWMDLVLEAALEQRVVEGLFALDEAGEGYCLQAPEHAQAIVWVQQWIEFYLRNWRQPQLLVPAYLWAGVSTPPAKGESEVSDEKRIEAVTREFDGDQFGARSSVFWSRCFPELSQYFSDPDWVQTWFDRYSWMLSPCFEHLKSEGDE